MTRILIAHLLEQLATGFDGSAEHSLLGNIRQIDDAGWKWKPQGGDRSIAGVIWHAGSAKFLWHSHAFGDGSITWGHPLTAQSHARTIDEALPWIREGHRLFVEGVASLSDGDLPTMRRVHWGEQFPASFVINSIMQHDLFHAGEINHLRALMQGNDRWGYFSGPPPSSPAV